MMADIRVVGSRWRMRPFVVFCDEAQRRVGPIAVPQRLLAFVDEVIK